VSAISPAGDTSQNDESWPGVPDSTGQIHVTCEWCNECALHPQETCNHGHRHAECCAGGEIRDGRTARPAAAAGRDTPGERDELDDYVAAARATDPAFAEAYDQAVRDTAGGEQ
jgi:hypothetical protein